MQSLQASYLGLEANNLAKYAPVAFAIVISFYQFLNVFIGCILCNLRFTRSRGFLSLIFPLSTLKIELTR
jgi:hypothetical protein